MPSGKKKKRHKMSTHKRSEAMSFEFVLCLNARLNEQTH